MIIDEDLMCSLKVLKPAEQKISQILKQQKRAGTLPKLSSGYWWYRFNYICQWNWSSNINRLIKNYNKFENSCFTFPSDSSIKFARLRNPT